MLEKRSPLGEVFTKCITKFKNGKMEATAFVKRPGVDNRLRAKVFNCKDIKSYVLDVKFEDSHRFMQIGTYRDSVSGPGIFGWGKIPAFELISIRDAHEDLARILTEHSFSIKFDAIEVGKPFSAQYGDTDLTIHKIGFFYEGSRYEKNIVVYYDLGTLKIPMWVAIWNENNVTRYLDILWNEWLHKWA